MSNPNEPVLNGKHDAASARIAELEAENARLKEQNSKLLVLSEAYLLEGLPRTKEEYQEMAANARPFRDLLAELEAKHGITGAQ